MNTRKTIHVVVSALALLAVLGCCENQAERPSTRPVSKADIPPLLTESATCNYVMPESMPAPKPKSAGARGEVKGDLVFNLGQGVYSNSESVLLAGGAARARSEYIPGGIAGRCANPLPEKYLQILAAAPQPAPLSPAAPVVAPVDPVLEPGAGSGFVVAGSFSCPVHPESAAVCRPVDGLSACFTLTEEQLEAGPAVMVPGAVAALELPPPAPVEIPVEAPAAVVAMPEPLPEPAPAQVQAPVVANVTDKYEHITVTEALEPPKLLDAPASAPKVEEKKEVATPAAVSNPVEVQTVPVAMPQVLPPPEELVREASAEAAATDDGIKVMTEAMPPIPQVTDMDEAVDAILSRDTSSVRELPSVELPPTLN